MTLGRNKRLSLARAWLHDHVCLSDGCLGDNDHARRTQHEAARRLVDAPDVDAVAVALHETFCRYHLRGECGGEQAVRHVSYARTEIMPMLPSDLLPSGADAIGGPVP